MQSTDDYKSHNHSAKHHKGWAQQKTKRQIYTGLNLIYITGQTGDHSGYPQFINFWEGQVLNMFQ